MKLSDLRSNYPVKSRFNLYSRIDAIQKELSICQLCEGHTQASKRLFARTERLIDDMVVALLCDYEDRLRY